MRKRNRRPRLGGLISFGSSRLISTSPACCLSPISGRPSLNSCATVFEPSGASLSLQPFGRLVTASTNASSNSNSKYTYPWSGSYVAWLTLNSNTASDSWPSPPLMSVSPTPTKRRKHYERHNDWQGSAGAHSAGSRAFGITGSGAALILFSCDDLK